MVDEELHIATWVIEMFEYLDSDDPVVRAAQREIAWAKEAACAVLGAPVEHNFITYVTAINMRALVPQLAESGRVPCSIQE